MAADTGFILVCAGLVFLMLPGLSLFYGGLVQSRNVLSTLLHSFILLAIGSLVWALVGYSLAFGQDLGGLIGGLDFIFLRGVGLPPGGPATTVPQVLFVIYEGMIACLAPALISGAYAERIKFPAMALFSTLWLLLIYAPLAHWVWGGGWLKEIGALDFAGGAVVHMSSGASALAAAHALGRRHLELGEAPPHNLPLALFGAGLLWFGWFGFNCGGAMAANGQAANALAATQLSGSAGMLGWLLTEKWHCGKPSTFGAASGALAGLVSITPAAGFVTPASALLIGFIGGALGYSGLLIKRRFGYDDTLDVVAIHGLGGTWGALATGLWATAAVGGVNGLFHGRPEQLAPQLISIVAGWAYCYLGSRLIFKVVGAVTPLRAGEAEEALGLDLGEHNERAYRFF